MSGYPVTHKNKCFSCKSYLISIYQLFVHGTPDVHYIKMYTHNGLMSLACSLS